MKKLVASGIALALALLCTGSAYALEVPTDTVVQNLNGVQQYIKTYTVEPGTDPQALIEGPFEYEGFLYTFAAITKEENPFEDSQTHRETVTVETAKSDLASVLAALSPSMEFSDGRYSGTLNLDHTTINTVASGYTTKSYTVSATKEIGNLDSNDMSYVPATTVKDGKTIQLQSVDWQVQGTALVDDVLVPSQYKAVATYSGKAYYNAATGYITTAEYVGEVSCSELESITYTVIYTGTAAPAEEAETDGLLGGSVADTLLKNTPWIGAAAIVTLSVLLARSRKRARAYQDETIEVSEIEEGPDDET